VCTEDYYYDSNDLEKTKILHAGAHCNKEKLDLEDPIEGEWGEFSYK